MSEARGANDPTSGVVVRRLSPDDAARLVPALANLLADCVNGGASVGFMAPMTAEKATRFWRMIADGVARGARALLVAEDDDRSLLGTVQLVLDLPENQPHRADVAKMLVAPRARRRGVARRLMAAVERVARDQGRTLLVLDTVTGSAADALYRGLGWQPVGDIPGYALMPDGRPCSTTVFFKTLAG